MITTEPNENGDAVCIDPFLIIAGVNKAGTTSLFAALAGHPQVSACSIKEPFFFLPLDIPFKIRPRIQTDPLSSYLALFPGWTPGKVRLEASSLYFGVTEATERIAKMLPNSRIVVSLRDPVQRLVSSYQMARFHGWLESNVTFDDFVARLFRARADRSSPRFDSMELEQGLYSKHLQRWREAFGPERVMTIWFDDLKTRPGSVIAQIADFAKLDAGHFTNVAIGKENVGRDIRWMRLRNAYSALKRAMRALIPPGSGLRRVAWHASQNIQLGLDRLTIRPAATIQPKADTLAKLKDFYRNDVVALGKLTGSDPPWLGRYVTPDVQKH